MTIRQEILHYIDEVPENSLQLLLQFVRFLRESPAVPAKREKKKRDRPRLLGVLEGQVWISDDFNDPMDFVSPEEQKVLEAMRAAKKAEAQLQEAAV
ncbi:MAG: DUF2281 domain-containing protein [Synergistaceae bacterium]|nr:DUF2281 domain-containing protein [Synergistaceae bacterium]MBQ3347078.1 DUF2281 domain-containing protein [Synergistaceae bacterium]MBQ3399446.1 DUF2281 domain-containing protein [Synergistaceae bacterium]MBQ3759088.1 DUF2281 domain-containing protein [Synergistaceae bacterium]MBQ4401966.1 DUF2281 domain-containing protein [Synergistaceae bacterium]